MTNRSRNRAIFATLASMLFVVVLCGSLTFILFGDELMDVARDTLLRISIAARQDELEASVSDDDRPIRFEVNSGDTPFVIANNLAASALILDADLFVDYVRIEDLDTQLEAGVYFLNQTQTIPIIAEALTDSSSSSITLRIIEGWRLEQVVEAIENDPRFGFSGAAFFNVIQPGALQGSDFAQAVGMPSGASMEGFLYPATYQLPPTVTPLMLRDELMQSFLSAIGSNLPAQAAARGLSIYEVVTLASIVEREALHDDEKPLIASVYLNRISINMRLDADPTVQYALGRSRGDWWPRITVADYQGVVSTYNTYRNNGLPPGPIANPGLPSIQAVVFPETSEYFYFRADCRSDGYHDFAQTYTEHLENGC